MYWRGYALFWYLHVLIEDVVETRSRFISRYFLLFAFLWVESQYRKTVNLNTIRSRKTEENRVKKCDHNPSFDGDQWRIYGISEWGVKPGGANLLLLFGIIFAKNCMKMKKKFNERSTTGHLCLEPFVIGVAMVPFPPGPILLKNESIKQIVILILVQVVVS